MKNAYLDIALNQVLHLVLSVNKKILVDFSIEDLIKKSEKIRINIKDYYNKYIEEFPSFEDDIERNNIEYNINGINQLYTLVIKHHVINVLKALIQIKKEQQNVKIVMKVIILILMEQFHVLFALQEQ